MARGSQKLIMFADDRDRRRFIKILTEAGERYGVEVWVECRMGTHFHVIVRTPRANISEFMQFLDGEFAKYFNRRYDRTGHILHERFKPILVDTGLYLRVVVSYVMNNPVEAGLVTSAADWRWSSYRATAGIIAPPSYLHLDWLEDAFPGSSRSESQALFERYVNAPSIEAAEICFAKAVYGGVDFKQRVRAHIAATLYTAAIPRAYRALHRPPLSQLLPAYAGKDERNSAVLRAHVVYAYTLAELGRYMRLHPGSVSRIISSIRKRLVA